MTRNVVLVEVDDVGVRGPAGSGDYASVNLADGISTPDAVPGKAVLYIDSADHKLKFVTGDGAVHVVTST